MRVVYARVLLYAMTGEASIRDLAACHDITAEPDDYDRLATNLSRLAGDDVTLDDVEMLLVHLARRGIVSGPERQKLHVAYIGEGGRR